MTTCPTNTLTVPAMEGALAYPRSNGEPVFDAPWQSRAFGMVVDLHKSGRFPWDDFKQRLIAEINAGRPAEVPAESSEYYYQWVEAFSRLVVETGLLQESEIAAREHEFQTGVRQEVF
jgi:nitrile hydratase accessory protein